MALRSYFTEKTFSDALSHALSQKDYTFIHAFDDERVIAGQGTIGIEITEDLKGIDFIIVPVGGGGLISGIAAAVKALSPQTRIIGVQTESATSAYDSFKGKKISDKIPLPTLADGIAVGRIGEKTFEMMNKYVDEMLRKRRLNCNGNTALLERKKLVVEGAGAAPLAALIENKDRFKNKRDCPCCQRRQHRFYAH